VKLAAAIVLTILLGTVGWFAILHESSAPGDAQWIEGLYQHKEAAAAQVPGPKVFLLGGSATHFSYSAHVLAEATGLNVVNFGTQASLGFDYELYRARRSIKSGDTVILVLETPGFEDSDVSKVLARYVDYYDPGYLLHSGTDLPRLIFGVSPLDYFETRVANRIPHKGPLYLSDTVDELGDETANTASNDTKFMRVRVHFMAPFKPVVVGRPMKAVQSFVAWAKARRVKVYFGWAPTLERSAYGDASYVASLNGLASSFREMDAPVLGVPSEFLLHEPEMLDTQYHATSGGRRRMTTLLAKELCKVTACPNHGGATQGIY
jgi:hypothetical protein